MSPARPRSVPPATPPAEKQQRSSVVVWRAAGSRTRRYSVRVVAGTSREELEQLIALALDAAVQLEGGVGDEP